MNSPIIKILSTCALLVVTTVFLGACATNPQPDWFDESKAHHVKTADGQYLFKNTYLEDKNKGFFDFLRMRFGGDEPWADPFANDGALAKRIASRSVDLDRIISPTENPQVTWLGHSTFLIQYKNINILTDPIFADRASPVSFAGPKRYAPHVIDYTQLPPIDIVIISHNHYDHLDKHATEILGNRPSYYVPLGLADWYKEQGISANKVVEMDWWQTQDFGDALVVKALPSQHWSARGIGDRFQSLWASWSIEFDDFKLFFAGDTGYNQNVFAPIGEAIGEVDLALIPIGAYAPRWFMKDYHTNPEEAVKIHQDVNARFSIGMHWGTFPLTAEPPLEPAEKLVEALQSFDVPANDFATIDIGETISLNK